MTIKEEIIAIANQLANQGKKPSVALIKNKLSAPTPLPTIIMTLKHWQHEPEKVLASTAPITQTIDESSTPLTKQQVEALLVPLERDVQEIKQMLSELLNAVKD